MREEVWEGVGHAGSEDVYALLSQVTKTRSALNLLGTK